jgi:para-aminobenzoate synthetase component 1
VLVIPTDDPDPFARFAHALERQSPARPTSSGSPPFQGGWLVALGYELGRHIEPTVIRHRDREDRLWPWPIVLWRCPWVWAFDHRTQQWWIGRGEPNAPMPDPTQWHPADPAPYDLAPALANSNRTNYIASVRRAVEYIHAGDCFQVNLAHHLRSSFEGSSRGLFHSLLRAAAPWYGAYLELPLADSFHAALSVSPELFLRLDAKSREVITRPIKGTRTTHAGASALHSSPKDRAELNMIIDLMRSDLGRVCERASVRVVDPHAIETHAAPSDTAAAPGLHHGVATVSGRLRSDQSIADLLRATFPGGSITGAPKVRAMQIIEELEPDPRGLYTGAIGFISDTGDMSLNIAIRTAILRGRPSSTTAIDEVHEGTLDYAVGAGIVADSAPEQEWQETLDKAGVLRNLPLPSTQSSPLSLPSPLPLPLPSGPGGATVDCRGRKPTETPSQTQQATTCLQSPGRATVPSAANSTP